jgi:hypothetical protein
MCKKIVLFTADNNKNMAATSADISGKNKISMYVKCNGKKFPKTMEAQSDLSKIKKVLLHSKNIKDI